MQEGFALRLAKQANLTREDRLHAQMMRLKIAAETLRRLAQSVACEHYVTTTANLETMKNLHQEGVLKDMGEIALALFYQLQAPGTGEDGEDPEEKTRRVIRKIKGIFGITLDPEDKEVVASGSTQFREGEQGAGPAEDEKDARYPNITAAEWEARAAAPAFGEYPHALDGDLRGAAQGHPDGVREGSVALRTRGGNRAHPRPRAAAAENARFPLSRSPAGHQPAAEAQTP
jgi:hypothetical protein